MSGEFLCAVLPPLSYLPTLSDSHKLLKDYSHTNGLHKCSFSRPRTQPVAAFLTNPRDADVASPGTTLSSKTLDVLLSVRFPCIHVATPLAHAC